MSVQDLIDILTYPWGIEKHGACNFVYPNAYVDIECLRCREYTRHNYSDTDVYICEECGYRSSNLSMSMRMQKILNSRIKK